MWCFADRNPDNPARPRGAPPRERYFATDAQATWLALERHHSCGTAPVSHRLRCDAVPRTLSHPTDAFRSARTELRRNLLRRGLPAELVDRRIRQMTWAFPDAMVTGYESLVDAMTNHPKDRHVLAAAVRANAEVIVTFNLSDFT